MIVDFYAVKLNGEIVMSGSCPEDHLKHQKYPGAEIRQGKAEYGKHYITAAGITELPTRPSIHHKFNYDTNIWVLNNEAAWIAVRTQRDTLLASTDWATLPDVPLDEETRNNWLAYRQALRDVTNQVDPLAIVWPIR